MKTRIASNAPYVGGIKTRVASVAWCGALLGLAACSDPLVGRWQGKGLDITVLDEVEGKYPFTGTVTVVRRDCALDGELSALSDLSYSYKFESQLCNFPGEGKCTHDEESNMLTCEPNNAPPVVLQKLED